MYATVQELVDALTPEEKAGLCTGAAVPRLGLPALRVNGLHLSLIHISEPTRH